jgi:hypothetical protein
MLVHWPRSGVVASLKRALRWLCLLLLGRFLDRAVPPSYPGRDQLLSRSFGRFGARCDIHVPAADGAHVNSEVRNDCLVDAGMEWLL